MEIVRNLLWTAGVVVVLQLVVIPAINVATKQSAPLHIAASLLAGLVAAWITMRVGGVDSPFFPAIAAVYMWMAGRTSIRLTDAAEFREANEVTVSKATLMIAHVLLVGGYILTAFLLSLDVCAGASCSSVI